MCGDEALLFVAGLLLTGTQTFKMLHLADEKGKLPCHDSQGQKRMFPRGLIAGVNKRELPTFHLNSWCACLP